MSALDELRTAQAELDTLRPLPRRLTCERLSRLLERKGLDPAVADAEGERASDRLSFDGDGEPCFAGYTGPAALSALADEIHATSYDPVSEGRRMAQAQKKSAASDSLSFR